MPGVLSSKIGHLDGNEIVEVEYDPARTNLPEMVAALKRQSSFYSLIAKDRKRKEAARAHISDAVIKLNPREATFIESKHSLRTRHPDLYFLDLTETQSIALNSWSYFGGQMPDVLTEKQKILRTKIRARLRTKSPRQLRPNRSGKGLQAYQEKLLNWLGEP